ncbi:hypothetical protein DFH11DRAFT_561049 [Phellopilus nigrolimitatus]|nr:hypothetical protein DFH11DRAFT_561049 [Phellopilus nigrolimitatus]
MQNIEPSAGMPNSATESKRMSSSLERSSLSALLPFFSSLPEGNNVNTDEFWGNLIEEHNSNLNTSSVTEVAKARGFKSARMIQKNATGMLLTLQTLARSLEEINASFKERTDRMALRHGLDSLPDEVLLHIFGDATSVFTEALELSHVCSRFRQVILGASRLWANCRLNTDMSLRQVEALVDRSRDHLLKVDIGPKHGNWLRHVKKLFRLKDRLEELEFYGVRGVRAFESDPISRLYTVNEMVNLRKLTINALGWPVDFSHFYRSWKLPNLKYLGFTNIVLEPVFRQNLSCCHIEFTGVFNPDLLTPFLRSLTSLETLEIDLVDISVENEDVENEDSDDEEKNEDNNANVQEDLSSRISNIASFSFGVIGTTSIPFARRVLETIRPNVTEMSLAIVHPECNRDSQIYWRGDYLLKSMRYFPIVEKLRIHLSGPNDYDLNFSTILLRLPQSLENLRFEAPGRTLSMDGCSFTLPRLRTLHFCDCDRMDLKFIEAVGENFNRVIENVEVVCCRPVEEENVRGAFPSSEVVWFS